MDVDKVFPHTKSIGFFEEIITSNRMEIADYMYWKGVAWKNSTDDFFSQS